MLKAAFKKYTLRFKQPAGTSRGVYTHKDSCFIRVFDDIDPDIFGIGECGLLKGLSNDDLPDYETKVGEVVENITNFNYYLDKGLVQYPSIRFGLEMALKDLKIQGESGLPGSRILFPSDFTQGKDFIEINGLVWMGDFYFMRKQVKEKIKSGFKCIKLKIGAIDFEKELELIRSIRKDFKPSDIEIRVDANGAFSPEEAMEKLKLLAELGLQSIEQPIRQGQWEIMASLCEKTPLPIALDEELIGIFNMDEKKKLLETVKPQYIILKPSLAGGFAASQEWIDLVKHYNIGWWVTSALESNIGLNAIAQWTYTQGNPLPQGLGTGQLYHNNFISPLSIERGKLKFDPIKEWILNGLYQ
ncbi:MAG: o-succinylbenzoate synthase [Bacteroidales bacterium]|nr:o-succinylbenzoate synthase [Bacteroidales bacterium]